MKTIGIVDVAAFACTAGKAFLEIHHQLEFGRILDGQLARLCAAQDAIHIGCSAPNQV
jgi:hypothetical protein